jgi:hypothetical protein
MIQKTLIEHKLARGPLHFTIPLTGSTQHQQPLITGVLMLIIFFRCCISSHENGLKNMSGKTGQGIK